MRITFKALKPLLLGLALFGLSINTAVATSVELDLTCVLNGLNSHACVDGPSFGTVSLIDMFGDHSLNPGEVRVTVDLAGTGHKFRDLMLNLGQGFTSVSSTDAQVSMGYNSYSITPYNGMFDIGSTGQKGWDGDDLYSTILTATGTSQLSARSLLYPDSMGKVYVAMHIQNIGNYTGGDCSGNDNGTTSCIPGITGEGSLKIGGVISHVENPEPATTALMGIGLVALAFLGRRHRRSTSFLETGSGSGAQE